MVVAPVTRPPRPHLAHIVADGGISVEEALHVAVDAAAGGELGKRGWVSVPLPLPHHLLAGLPLCQHLLEPRCHCGVHLYSDHTVTMEGAPGPLQLSCWDSWTLGSGQGVRTVGLLC